MKLLYVIANPQTEEQSFGLRVGRQVLAEIHKSFPQVEVHTLDLYAQPIQEIDRDVLQAWGSLATGVAFTELSATQQAKVGQMNDILEKFLEADRLLIVNPMWNYGTPPRFKAFLDSIVIANRTFKYTEQGPVGLVRGKKVLHIIASGGMYSQGPKVATEAHTEGVLRFLGVSEVHTVWVEGTAMTPPEQVGALIEGSVQKANALLSQFFAPTEE